jgi:prevent-host-death family protein
METIAASKLRENLMKILKQIEKGSSILITSRGRPVAQLNPPPGAAKQARDALADLSRTAVIGDIVSPIDEPWEESP